MSRIRLFQAFFALGMVLTAWLALSWSTFSISEGHSVELGLTLGSKPSFLFFDASGRGWMTAHAVDETPALLLSADEGDTWSTAAPSDLTGCASYRGAFFTDARRGFLLCSDGLWSTPGELFTSVDGGARWTPIGPVPDGEILSLHVESPEHFILVTERGVTIVRDAAAPRTTISFGTFRARGAAVGPNLTIWTVGTEHGERDSSIRWLVDDSTEWQRFAPSAGTRLFAIAAPSDDHVVAAGNSLWSSSDAGFSFELMPYQPRDRITALGFTDIDSAWALCVRTDYTFAKSEIVHQQLLSTADGGRSWSLEAELPANRQPVLSAGAGPRPMLWSYARSTRERDPLRKHESIFFRGVF